MKRRLRLQLDRLRWRIAGLTPRERAILHREFSCAPTTCSATGCNQVIGHAPPCGYIEDAP